MRNACLIGAGSASSGETRLGSVWEAGGGMMERAPRQLGVGLKVKGLWVKGGGAEIDGG